jgi:organic hydroperoxide reductase OsmC/OhrA/CheY-like chemotaxis protein
MPVQEVTIIRIAIAEEHRVFRWALREAFAKVPDMLVVGEAGTVEDTLEMLRGARPDVLLLDITLPDHTGYDLQLALRERARRVATAGGDQEARSPEQLRADPVRGQARLRDAVVLRAFPACLRDRSQSVRDSSCEADREGGSMVAPWLTMAIAPFPHRYGVQFSDGQLAAEPRAPIRAGAPPQFGGSDDVWSPEHLLVGAALACLKATFDAYARRARLAVVAWRGTATGVLDKRPGGPVFTAIDIDVDIMTELGDEARAQEILATAERDCIVSRSLVAPVRCTGRITAAPSRAAG